MANALELLRYFACALGRPYSEIWIVVHGEDLPEDLEVRLRGTGDVLAPDGRTD
ncbi:MAG TPA: hypothetical protein VGR27_02165 [Longimicrobiaceae bacterium]|nr:hypothetical protein [Longimicrobiaceae bacterium]